MRKVCEPNITPSGEGNAVPEQTREGLASGQPFASLEDEFISMMYSEPQVIRFQLSAKKRGKGKGGTKKC